MVSIKKRGQAALEFLTTYGWAFLVILVMISALGYFGILNPDRFLPERCNVGPEFACVEYAVYDDTTDNFVFIFTNNVGQTITNLTVVQTQVRDANDSSPSCADNIGSGGVRAGSTIRLDCNLSALQQSRFGAVGSKVRVDVDLTYDVVGLTLPKPLSAQIYATLQEPTS